MAAMLSTQPSCQNGLFKKQPKGQLRRPCAAAPHGRPYAHQEAVLILLQALPHLQRARSSSRSFLAVYLPPWPPSVGPVLTAYW